ncbi:MAG: non-canonical purine NTP pyrophosphatase, RdgB/HAM1 family [Crocinitomicaceae bacterium]|nr:non-canonical purine NTP pyrophosphatase, RdgB/HAM1 family [Crocinitomicaceae bacterium]
MLNLGAISELKLEVIERPLIFKKPAKTSRDTLSTKPCYYLKATNSKGLTALGECSLIPGLSVETEVEALEELKRIASGDTLDLGFVPRSLPSVRFAVEMLLMELNGSRLRSGFSNNGEGLDINGLIWMADAESMVEQAMELKSKGFTTIKLKVGALDFQEELSALRKIREICPHPEYTLRLDANGAFNEDAIEKLKALSEFNVHSLEQPVAPGNLSMMREVAEASAIDIALDEELIGVESEEQMVEILERSGAKYIILKPSLIGGLSVANKWIELAQDRGIKWWSTSALESNVGLKAIADWAGYMLENTQGCEGVSGLGTGSLYTNNTESDLEIVKGQIFHTPTPTITINGRSTPLTKEGIVEFEGVCDEDWSKELLEFLKFWFNSNSPIEVMTSGSTGAPKLITHSREAVIFSAQQTLDFFDLRPGDSALLALPINFIAGKLMLVRAIIGRLHITAINPNLEASPTSFFNFTALTPHQIARLNGRLPFGKILLGGAPVSSELAEKLSKEDAYEGFGMTETITHIALRKVHPSAPSFEALPGVKFSESPAGTLTIDALDRNIDGLITDDIVTLNSPTTFSWHGRSSDIINSGGIKFSPEILEAKLKAHLSFDLAIYGVPHSDLGECIELRVDLQHPVPLSVQNQISASISATLKSKEAPRNIVFAPILRNPNGKTNRKKMSNQASRQLPVIVFATGNKNKALEVQRLLDGIYTVKSLPEIGCHEDIPETSNTLEGNAAIKARYVKEKYGYDCFADDTGLEVSALGGAPGVYTARYGGPEKNADKNIAHLLSELNNSNTDDRSAQFRTAIHVITGKSEKLIEGICKGQIATERSGNEGFGYDSVFIPEGENRTFSEMSGDEKNKISHRGIAIREMLEYLSSLR